jgi:HlyD family type I secretion membrane fusion protein
MTTMLPVPVASPLPPRELLIRELSAAAARSTRWSGWIAGGLAVGFLGLSALPMSSGAVAPGVLATPLERQAIQHADGGVIRELLVVDGQHVEAGDPLMRLESVEAGAAAGVLASQILDLRADEVVRLAEVLGLGEFTYPPELVAAATDARGQAILAAHRSAFEARRAQREVQLAQADSRIVQIDEQMTAAQARYDSATEQLALIRDELEGLRTLYERGLVERTRVLALERTEASLVGDIATAEAGMRQYRASISEVLARREEFAVTGQVAAADALRELRAELSAAIDRATAADDTLERTTLRAPIAGVVVNRRVDTVGGVAGSGEVLMEIVPENEGLVVRANVRPIEAEMVHVGAEAVVRFDFVGTASAPRVIGSVSRMSADALTDETSGQSYFEAIVELPPEAVDQLPEGAMSPGLPVEVLIRSEDRSLMSYLVDPLSRVSFRALRER